MVVVFQLPCVAVQSCRLGVAFSGVSRVSNGGESMLSSRLTLPGEERWHFFDIDIGVCLSCTCPVHLLFRLNIWLEVSITLTHKHPFLNSSGRRLAVLCFSLFLRKGGQAY